MKSLDQILGLPVITSDAKSVGIVKDIGISTENWKVSELEVAQKKRVIQIFTENIFIPSENIQALCDTVMLDFPSNELMNSIEESPRGKMGNSLLGTDIILKDANKIGCTDMIFFKSDTLDVSCIRVKPERKIVDELGLNGSQPLYLKVEDVKAAGDMIIVDITKEEFTTVPKD